MLHRRWVGEKPVQICRDQSVVLDKMKNDHNVDKGGG